MKKIFVILGIMIWCNNVYADCISNIMYGTTCRTWKPGVENNCGNGCTYTYDEETKTINVTTTGENTMISGSAFRPIAYENNTIPTTDNIVINGVIKLSSNVFNNSTVSISGADGTLVLTGVGHHAFGVGVTLDGNVVIPANATFDSLAFHGVTLADGAKIYCAVKNCAQKMIDSCQAYTGTESRGCLNYVNSFILDSEKFEQAPEGCDFWSATGCSKCTNSNYSLEYGYCYRKRYTIPEADAATSNDNENMIEWIFE